MNRYNPLTGMPVKEFESRRARFPTDRLFAKSMGITQSTVSEYRRKNGIQAYRGLLAGQGNLGVQYHPRRPMTEEQISALYGGRRYEDNSRAILTGMGGRLPRPTGEVPALPCATGERTR